MIISAAAILACNPRHPTADTTASKLTWACQTFGIEDPRSVAAMLANYTVESGLLPNRENLLYTTSARLAKVWPSKFGPRGSYDPREYVGQPERLANLVYAGKLGNGDAASGDGWAFRGGGYPQLTGRDTYTAAGRLIGYDLAQQPALIEQIGVSALAGCAYWTRMSSADRLAQAGDIAGTRRAVNGPAMLGLSDMLSIYRRVRPLLQSAT
ncbi:glycoside hydrolase family 19 protein [Deinococcus ruber]|uniref:Uncharacterized protein n=1 Tax=Deinococcus ruber TaxID=1848197 RepID=A0A918CD16_9DEIO|nr:glycoside hydrolase family 19 protein [Deinococcus ruber]GGR18974.1 hypothetical protein GCM10008957_34550 [Deinococcus ruber]